MTENPIEITDLHKSFDSAKALDGLDLTARPGEVTGFLGPNGAGKSTTIRVLRRRTPHPPGHGEEPKQHWSGIARRAPSASNDRAIVDLFILAGSVARRSGALSRRRR